MHSRRRARSLGRLALLRRRRDVRELASQRIVGSRLVLGFWKMSLLVLTRTLPSSCEERLFISETFMFALALAFLDSHLTCVSIQI